MELPDPWLRKPPLKLDRGWPPLRHRSRIDPQKEAGAGPMRERWRRG